ncbi:MAG TPA: hypothetical protein VN047_07370 [Sphingopyxis sp.]|uniref:hypothetical protein n=1 Tax=Sphingopyxis sp. TaxID=1908224 RepID=UPI002CDF37CC|nr:hypothetical protein [Sphingopyxis sp.]HWW56697.1 hypothetical protein [Sphingopyxis sp.]
MKFAIIAKLSRLAVAVGLGISAAPAAQAQTAGDFEYVAEYGAMIGADDRVSSSGAKLSDPAAILQQDRYNVDVRGVLQPGDSADDYFADRAHRAAIAKAAIEFTDDQARGHVVNGTYPLLVAVKRAKDGRLTLFVSTSDGEPADDSEAAEAELPMPAGGIPAAFHGRWAASRGACAASPLEMLTIDERGLHQAEGEMLAERVASVGGLARIAVDARNSGGGEDWTSTEELTLSTDENRIDWRQLKPEQGAIRQLFRCEQN